MHFNLQNFENLVEPRGEKISKASAVDFDFEHNLLASATSTTRKNCVLTCRILKI